MDSQDCYTAGFVRAIDQDLPVKPSRSEHRSLQNFRSVGGGHEDDADSRIKAVHLNEQLCERLLALVMGHPSSPAGSRKCIQLIKEDGAGSLELRLPEEISYPGGADPDGHLHELRSAEAKKWDTGFPCYCTRQ